MGIKLQHDKELFSGPCIQLNRNFSQCIIIYQKEKGNGLGVRRLACRLWFTAVNLETWLNMLFSLDTSFLSCYGWAVIGEDSMETLVDVPVTTAINKLSQIGIKQKQFYCAKDSMGQIFRLGSAGQFFCFSRQLLRSLKGTQLADEMVPRVKTT